MYSRHRGLVAIGSLLLATPALPAQGQGKPVIFDQAWVRGPKSEKDIRMQSSRADLVIDTIARRLIVKNKHLPLNVSFDSVTKLTFDVSTHMRGGSGDGGLGVVGAIVTAKIQGGTVSDYWCVIEYLDGAGVAHRQLLEIGKKQAGDVLALLTRLLPSAVEDVHFAEQQREVPKEEVEPFDDAFNVKVVMRDRPAIPAGHPDSALVVVAAPTIDFDDAGAYGQYRLYANRNIVAVTKMGMYAFFHLAPGTYSLLSKAGNMSALDITVEAGKQYYFFQNSFMGFASSKVKLTRQSEALVRQEVTGMFYSDWRPKAD